MKHSYKHRWLMLIAISALLTACGGGSSRDDSGTNTGTGTGPDTSTGSGVGSVMDSFTTLVSDLLGTSSEEKEPVAVSDQAIIAPENTEPAAIK